MRMSVYVCRENYACGSNMMSKNIQIYTYICKEKFKRKNLTRITEYFSFFVWYRKTIFTQTVCVGSYLPLLTHTNKNMKV